MGQGSECGLGGCSWLKAFHEVGVRLSGAAVSSKGSAGGALASRLTLWLLAGFTSSWALGLRASAPCWSSVAFLSSLQHGPLHRTTHHTAAGFPQSRQISKNERVKRRVPKIEATVFLQSHLGGDIPLLLLYSPRHKRVNKPSPQSEWVCIERVWIARG